MRNERDFPSAEGAGTGQGVGARLPRKEDDRLMRGRGQYVADIRLSGLQDVAFVRSPLAHARMTLTRREGGNAHPCHQKAPWHRTCRNNSNGPPKKVNFI